MFRYNFILGKYIENEVDKNTNVINKYVACITCCRHSR